MEKNGFTLSEILVSLGVIGVIAAISISSLVKSTQTAHIGPSIAKFKGNFETAVFSVMQREKLDSLTESDYSGTDGLRKFMSTLENDAKLIFLAEGENVDNYLLNADSAIQTLSAGGKKVYQTREGFFVCALDSNWLVLDINGKKNPNKPGQDRFLFYLDPSGKLLPWGKSKLYYDRIKKLVEDIDSYSSDCDIASNDPWNGYACTGKIADNGWKAD